MKIKSLKNWFVALACAAFIFTSCEKTEDKPEITANNLKGMFVICEGVFGHANGDISYYDSKSDQSTKNLYSTVNGVTPGDIVQSFEIADTLGFIVVNNSQKVIVVNMKDFKVVKTISGFSYPRSVVRADESTVYVSNGDGFSKNYIYSIDLTTLKKTDSLVVSTGPEKLILNNSKVYAAIAGGFKSDGNSVIEIDPASFTIVNTFTVASVPADITADKNNNIWAYCKGVPDYSNYPNVTYANAGISKINVSSKIVNSFPLTIISSSGINNITTGKDGSMIYYLNDGLYSMSVNATALPTSKVINHLFYGVDIDPQNGNIVCLDDVESKAIIYNTAGIEQKRFETSKFPNSVIFSRK
jgi:hypothetical protein